MYWFGVAALFYTFLGYQLLIQILSKLCPKKPAIRDWTSPPSLCVVVAACNEEKRIGTRINNLLASDYPSLRILVVSDGSTDSTAQRVIDIKNQKIQLIVSPNRSGKPACLNLALAQVTEEIVVFADARQRFATDTISRLVAHFSDPKIGAVSGSLEIDPSVSTTGQGVDAYWRLERSLRSAESKLDSCIGCTGAVYAIRRELFQTIPEDTILDDVVIPMKIAMQGYRVIFEPAALAIDPQPLEPKLECSRKTRTLAGNFQMLIRYPEWLLPWRNRLWWQLISHKYLRLSGPPVLLLVFFANLGMAGIPIYRFLFAAQFMFYLLAFAGMIFGSRKYALFHMPAGFVFLNAMIVRGFLHFLKGTPTGVWTQVQTDSRFQGRR